jgi:hypothetical protein
MDQKIASMVHADGPCAHIGGGTVGFAGMRPTDAFPSRSSAFLRSVALMMTHHRTSKKRSADSQCRFVPGLAKSHALLNLSSRGLIVFFTFEQSSVEHPETFSLEG